MSIHQLGVSIAVLWFRFVSSIKWTWCCVCYVLNERRRARARAREVCAFRDRFSRSMFKLTIFRGFYRECFSNCRSLSPLHFYSLREWIDYTWLLHINMQVGIMFLLCFCEFVLVDSWALDYFLWYKTILCYVNNYEYFPFIYIVLTVTLFWSFRMYSLFCYIIYIT